MSRFGIPAIVFAVLIVFVLLECCAPSAYFAALAVLQIPKVTMPFSDLWAVLQAVHCAGEGVNVYVRNACMNGGVYNYSPLLLRVSWLGGLTGHLNLAGLVVALLFIASLAALPAPQNRREFWIRAFASVSAAVIFALERANLDAMIFIFAVCGILFCLRNAVARLIGYALFCIAAMLKYYPAALLFLLLRESPRRLMALAALLAVAAVCFMARFGAGTLASLAIVPHTAPVGNFFGAIDIPLFISMVTHHGGKPSDPAQLHLPQAMQLVLAAMILMTLWRGAVNMRLYRPAMVALPPTRLAFLIGGAALACFCFFTAQNGLYRAVLLLLALPGVCSLGLTIPKARGLSVAMVLVMWESLFRIVTLDLLLPVTGPGVADLAVLLIWLGRELLWWWIIAQFLALLFIYAETAFVRCRVAIGRPDGVAVS